MLQVSNSLFAENNPKPRSNISAAWSHFTRKSNGVSALCNYCNADVAVPSGSTSGMFSHLQRLHPEVHKKEITKKKEILKFIDRVCSENLAGGNTDDEDEVHIKANDVFHLPKTIFPELISIYKNLPNQKIYNDITGYDVLIHCQDGILSSHKLMLGSASPFMRSIFTWRDVDHIFLGDFKKCTVSAVLEALYSGNAETLSVQSQELALTLGISLTTEQTSDSSITDDNIAQEDITEQEDGTLVIKEEELIIPSDDSTEETADDPDDIAAPIVQMTVDTTEDSSEASSSNAFEIDARVMMLKHQIYQECALNNVRVNQSRNTHNQRRPTRPPSKIWKWFIKTPTTLTCLVCNAELRNCGNTTNAAFHLRKHPFHYNQFRTESEDQQKLYVPNTRPIKTQLLSRELPLLAPRPSLSPAPTPGPAESSTSSTQPKPTSMKQYYTPPVKVALPRRKQYESPKGLKNVSTKRSLSEQHVVQRKFVKILPKPSDNSVELVRLRIPAQDDIPATEDDISATEDDICATEDDIETQQMRDDLSNGSIHVPEGVIHPTNISVASAVIDVKQEKRD